jgi:PIN domain nuclease of toxin-antitoxin system
MNLLLDTHAFIWFMDGSSTLPTKPKNSIINIKNDCDLSIASIWEIAIKVSIGNLNLTSDFSDIAFFLEENNIEILPIGFNHIQELLSLDWHHRDPFDRIIIAQGLTEDLTIITKDKHFSKYPCKLLWS